jgi:hypothetical protein
VLDQGQILAMLESLGVEVRALRRDLDSLRQEVRSENATLRAQLALFMSRQNQVISDTKKKQSLRPGWALSQLCPSVAVSRPTA